MSYILKAGISTGGFKISFESFTSFTFNLLTLFFLISSIVRAFVKLSNSDQFKSSSTSPSYFKFLINLGLKPNSIEAKFIIASAYSGIAYSGILERFIRFHITRLRDLSTGVIEDVKRLSKYVLDGIGDLITADEGCLKQVKSFNSQSLGNR